MVKKNSIFLLAIVTFMFMLFMTACYGTKNSIDNSETSSLGISEEKNTTNEVEDFLDSTSIPNQEIVDNKVVNSGNYSIYNKEQGLSPLDFDTAYEMCKEAIEDYYTSYETSIFDEYIENQQLKAYLNKCVEWELPNRYIRKIGIDKAEICQSNSTGEQWFYFHIFIEFTDAGATNEIIVKESLDGEKLVIADWYFPGNLSLDDQTRKISGPISDPNIWEDSAFSDEILKKAKEILERR